jgi:hypothetical protein
VIRRLPNSLFLCGKIHGRTCECKCSLLNLGKGKNTKGSIVGPGWKLEAKRACFHSSGAFKIYRKLWEVENQVIPIQ